MTTGRINQVAIRIAEAASDGSGDRSADVQSAAFSTHESTNVAHYIAILRTAETEAHNRWSYFPYAFRALVPRSE